jgi:hypothetical protein
MIYDFKHKVVLFLFNLICNSKLALHFPRIILNGASRAGAISN